MEIHPLIWTGFVLFVLAMLALDLLVFHREAHEIKAREAATWAGIWMAMGVAFTFVVWAWLGGTRATEYFTGYLLEKALSVDNIFVFVLIFSYFAVPAAYQYRVLFWGILGALFFRAAFILGGAALLHRFDFMFYVFGGFLVITGLRMARHGDVEVHPDRNPILRVARRLIPMTPTYRGQAFFTKENGRRMATPLLAVLIVVETTDIIFAVDSIPAIFGVTREPFIVFSSNAFAILGLRALYFLLADMMKRFRYLQPALAGILVFIGVKMILEDVYHAPVWVSLVVIVVTLTVAVVMSIRVEGKERALHSPGPPDTPEPPGDPPVSPPLEAGEAQDSPG